MLRLFSSRRLIKGRQGKMATYIISDIFGDSESFEKLMNKVGFSENEDFLIVNGDILDRGNDGVGLLFKMKELVRKNRACVIKGEHELLAEMYLEGKITENRWERFGGAPTIKALNMLDEEKKSEILRFIKEMPLYEVYDIPVKGTAVIASSGINESMTELNEDGRIDVLASVRKAVESDQHQFLISADIHYWPEVKLKNLDKYIICGHQPTYQLGPEYKGMIYRSRYYMDIDTGNGYRDHGGRLACFSVEDGREFYV